MQISAVKGFRLSPLQTRLWHTQCQGQVFRSLCVVQIEGNLNQATWHQAIHNLVVRHEVLHTTFAFPAGLDTPLQVIENPATYSYEVADLRNLSALQQQAQCDQIFAACQEHPFDLMQAPLLRVSLLCLSDDIFVAVFVLPALCADSATLQHIVTELLQEYHAVNKHSTLNSDILQYADVASWQHDLLQEESAQIQRSYWETIDFEQARNFSAPFAQTPVAADLAMSHVCIHAFSLQPSIMSGIVAQASRNGITLEAYLLTCWLMLLRRLTDSTQVFTGVVCNGRVYEELAGALGAYTGTVPVALQFEELSSFAQALPYVQTLLENAQEKQFYFQYEPIPDQDNYLPVSFEYERWPQQWREDGLALTWQRQYCCIEPFVLKFHIVEQGERFQLALQYDEAHLSAAAVSRIASAIQVLAVETLAQPLCAVEQYPLLDVQQHAWIEKCLRPTKNAHPVSSLQKMFVEQAACTPEHVAVKCGGRSLTYQQLDQLSNQVAHCLHEQQVRPQEYVALLLDRSIDWFVYMLGILKAGGIYVPLDPEQPGARLQMQLEQSAIQFVITQQQYRHRLLDWTGHCWYLDGEQEQELLNRTASTPLEIASEAGGGAYVIFTSGSTGTPKGVMVRQQGVVNYIHALKELLHPQIGWQYATVSTLAADLGNTAIFCALTSGGCLHILDYATVTDAAAFADYVQQNPLDVLKIVPSHLQALLQACTRVQILPRQYLILGGEALRPQLLAQIRASAAPCRVINHYGPTEVTIGAIAYPLEASTEFGKYETIPIGRPLTNLEAYVFDSYMHEVPVGVTGELYLGGPGLATGYLYRPDQTGECFVPHPYAVGQRLYRTGDQVRMTEEGLLEFCGRLDNQVKVRGHRIELGEIEEAVRRHSNVLECVVLLHNDDGDEPQLVSYIVPWQQPAPTSQELRAFLQEKLPEAMIPTTFVFVHGLPLTPNGKVDKQKLPAPQPHRLSPTTHVTLPRSPIEEALVMMWEDILYRKPIDIHANFFQLGGHSLLATQVIARVHTMFAIDISILRLFETPTIAGLAGYIEVALRRDAPGTATIIAAGTHERDIPLSFSQQRLWFLSQFEPEHAFYSKTVAFNLAGPLHVEFFCHSLQAIVDRHEILRTCFQVKHTQPYQVVKPLLLEQPVLDITALPSAEQALVLQQLGRQELHSPFDLSQGPLIRVKLIRVGAEQHCFLLTVHHIIWDAWSNDIFLRELTSLYAARVAAQPHPLPPLHIQYADFAVWQRQWLESDAPDTQLLYWKRQLADAPGLDLPYDYPRPAIQRHQGRSERLQLTPAMSQELKRLSQREGVTLFMTLLAAFNVLLLRYSGQDDICIGTPIAQRQQTEIEGVIGFFVNSLVLRTRLDGDPSFCELLRRVRDVALGAYAHQDVPFEKLVEVLEPQRDMSRTPLFQVLFALHNTPLAAVEFAGLTFDVVEVPSETAKFDLSFVLADTEQGLYCELEYDSDLFDATTIQSLLAHWQTLLEHILRDPEQRLSRLDLLTAAEHRQLLVNWGELKENFPVQVQLHEAFAARAIAQPDAIAVCYEEHSLSYGELNARADQLACSLRSMAVGPEVIVGLCLERSIEMLIGILGIMKAGGAYLPLDPLYPDERLTYILSDAQAPVLLTQQSFLERLNFYHGQVLTLDAPYPAIMPDAVPPAVEGDPGHIAYVIYTSGSTGMPKGVQVSHASAIRLFAATKEWFQFGSDDVWTLFHSYAFDFSVWEIWGALLHRGRLVIVPHWISRAPEAFYRLLLEQAVTVLNQTPSAFRQLSPIDEISPYQKNLALRYIVFGGEALSPEDVRPWLERHGELYPYLINMYGITETTVHATYRPLTKADMQATSGSVIGHALQDIQLYILDQHLRPAPIGVPGELYLGGACLARGYLQRPALTSERFIPHPYSQKPGARLYRTGDRARYLANGDIEYLGRLDQQVKIRGFRIELGEIEVALASYPGIMSAVVVDREDEHGAKFLAAYMVVQAPLSFDDIRHYLRKKLPEYMLPTFFVEVEQFPLTPNGKVDRQALPAFEKKHARLTSSFVPAATPAEEVITSVWRQVLGIELIGLHDSFFDLGGHSLLATQVVARLREVFQIEIPLRSLFEHPTVAGVVLLLTQLWGERAVVEEIALTFQALEQLSEEGLDALLNGEKDQV